MNYAIVLSGGKGTRMGAAIPKQYLEVLGQPVIYYSLKAVQESPLIDRIIVVVSREYEDYIKELMNKNNITKAYAIAYAGKERHDSVYSGLNKIPTEDITDTNICLIHDGARPMLDNEIIESCVESCRKYKASIAAVAVKDTIKVSDDKGFAIETPDRSKLYQVQTPQSFTVKLVYDSYTQMYKEGKTEGVTDDAMVVSAFGKVEPYLTKSSYKNIKITTPEDLSIAECFLKIK